MKIRITDAYADDLPLSYWGIAEGDEFEVNHTVDGAFLVEFGCGYVVVYPGECEVIDE